MVLRTGLPLSVSYLSALMLIVNAKRPPEEPASTLLHGAPVPSITSPSAIRPIVIRDNHDGFEAIGWQMCPKVETANATFAININSTQSGIREWILDIQQIRKWFGSSVTAKLDEPTTTRRVNGWMDEARFSFDGTDFLLHVSLPIEWKQNVTAAVARSRYQQDYGFWSSWRLPARNSGNGHLAWPVSIMWSLTIC